MAQSQSIFTDLEKQYMAALMITSYKFLTQIAYKVYSTAALTALHTSLNKDMATIIKHNFWPQWLAGHTTSSCLGSVSAGLGHQCGSGAFLGLDRWVTHPRSAFSTSLVPCSPLGPAPASQRSEMLIKWKFSPFCVSSHKLSGVNE